MYIAVVHTSSAVEHLIFINLRYFYEATANPENFV